MTLTKKGLGVETQTRENILVLCSELPHDFQVDTDSGFSISCDYMCLTC